MSLVLSVVVFQGRKSGKEALTELTDSAPLRGTTDQDIT